MPRRLRSRQHCYIEESDAKVRKKVPVKLLNNLVLQLHKNLTKERRQYWYDRGCNDQILNYFKIGYSLKNKAYIFPYFDQDGNCYFFKAIRVNKSQYWVPASGDFIRIFNIHDIKEAREKKQPLHICEGENDTLIMKMNGFLCIGISGANGFKEEYHDVEVI